VFLTNQTRHNLLEIYKVELVLISLYIYDIENDNCNFNHFKSLFTEQLKEVFGYKLLYSTFGIDRTLR